MVVVDDGPQHDTGLARFRRLCRQLHRTADAVAETGGLRQLHSHAAAWAFRARIRAIMSSAMAWYSSVVARLPAVTG